MRDDAFPVARLGRLLGKSVHTLYREVRHGRYGAPFRRYGRLHVYIAGIERAEKRKFSHSELVRALAPPRPAAVPEPLDIQLETTIRILDHFEEQKRAGQLFTREQTLALIEHNLALRDIQWLQLQRRQMNQQSPEGRAIIPHEIPERECPDNDGEPA